MSTFTAEELRSLNRIGRDLYARLVLNLKRDPVHTMQVMALWMWIDQQMGFPNIVRRLLNLSDVGLKAAADEAVWCLNCLESGVPPIAATDGSIDDLPVTRRFLAKEISLQFFHENRSEAITWIAKKVNDECLPAFEDIAKEAYANNPAQEVLPQGTINSGSTALLQMEGIGEVVKPYLVPKANNVSRGGSTANRQLEGTGQITNPSATTVSTFSFPSLTIPGLEAPPPTRFGRPPVPRWPSQRDTGESSRASVLDLNAVPKDKP